MEKLLILALSAVAFAAKAQAPGILPAAEQRKHERQIDSLKTLIAKRRKEIEAYNRAHPVKKTAAKSSSIKH